MATIDDEILTLFRELAEAQKATESRQRRLLSQNA